MNSLSDDQPQTVQGHPAMVLRRIANKKTAKRHTINSDLHSFGAETRRDRAVQEEVHL